eukprot:scaffold78598_cov20-Tisochrysis_lutea.AAC.1
MARSDVRNHAAEHMALSKRRGKTHAKAKVYAGNELVYWWRDSGVNAAVHSEPHHAQICTDFVSQKPWKAGKRYPNNTTRTPPENTLHRLKAGTSKPMKR